jgi:hypothetical protein
MRNVNHRAYVWQPRPLVAALGTARVPTRALPSRLSLPTKEGRAASMTCEVADRDIGRANQVERLPHLVRRPEDPSKSGARNLDCSHGLVT